MPKIAVNPLELTNRLAAHAPSQNATDRVLPAFSEIIDSLPEPAYLLDRAHRWVHVNRAYCAYMGRARSALTGLTSADIFPPDEAGAAWESDETAFNAGTTIVNESVMTDAPAQPRVLQTRKTIVRGNTGQPYLFGIVRDLTGTDDAFRLLRGTDNVEPVCRTRNLGLGQVRSAFSDPLTRLPNRCAVINLIDTIAARDDVEMAVLVFNIDHFALVNDRFGHGAGDAVIVEVARRLRLAAGTDYMLGRLDNDEFIVVAEHCDAMQADLLAERILGGIAEPMKVGDYDYRPSASTGIALMPEHGRTAPDLVRNAGIAMRWCKLRRRGGSERYCNGTHAAADRRASIELRLPLAVEAGELTVHYQPFVAGGDATVRGFEALARWRDANLGDVEASEFIAVAEGMGIIRKIGQTVLDDACKTIAAFGDDALSVSVNVSGVQLLDETFPILVAETLQRRGIAGEQLLLEITETVAMEADPVVLRVLKELSDIGVRLLIDDFGTGFSNLARLKTLPLAGIKIDRAFICDLPQSKQDAAIFRATHAIATALDLVVVVEGVESAAQDEFVRQFDVDYLQGYHYGRPLPAKKLKRYTR